MPERPGCHLDYDDRCVIEEGIEAGLSASAIARRLEVSPSTVTREVKANRHGRPSRAKAVRPARKCANYDGCRRFRDVCGSCSQEGRRGACRLCGLASCPDLCPDFAPRVCALLDRWPYLCRCDKARRARCDLPKFRYDARKAQESSDGRLVHSRTGISISEEELASMLDAVAPLIRNGLSPEAVWLGLGDRLPVGVRTFYSWMESGVVDVPAIHLPRKVRCRPRRKRRGAPPAAPSRGAGTPSSARCPWRSRPGRPRWTRWRGAREAPPAYSPSTDLCQDFGHGSSRNHAAMGSLSSAGLVRSKNNSMARAGIW